MNDEPNAINDGTWLRIRRVAKPPHPGLHRSKAAGRNGAIITHCGLVGGPIWIAPTGRPIVACPECLAVT